MQVAELYAQVSQLGFETSLDDGKARFYQAAGRALLQINALRPRRAVLELSHRTPHNSVISPSFKPVFCMNDVVYEGVGVKAYYFECDGTGKAVIEAKIDGEWELIGEVDMMNSGRKYRTYRGFIKRDGDWFGGEVRLSFTGLFAYSIRCVALYDVLYGPTEDDIPAYGPFYAYHMHKETDDFLSWCTPPILVEETDTMLNQEYRIENDGTLLLPYGADGLYRVHYNRLPKPLVDQGAPEEDTSLIDLDEELCALMPLLIASFVWAEDEPELSEYYLTLYRERAADIDARNRNATPVLIKNVYGW